MSPIRIYVTLVVLAAAAVAATAGWTIAAEPAAHWNAVAAFLVLSFLTEASYFRLRVGSSETTSSVSFIPFIASLFLFDSGWAAAVAASAMCAVDFAVRRKAPIRVVFNAGQMFLSIGLASEVYQFLGGSPATSSFGVSIGPAIAGVATYFAVNGGAVSLAVALGDGVKLREAWLRIAGSSLVYDLFSAPLGVLLAFCYHKLEILGILVFFLPLYFVRHIYRVNLQLEQVNRDLLELMVKAIEARDPYTSGHSQRVAQLAELIARELGLSARFVEQIRTAALLHDVGKIHEEYAPLLRKEGKLDATEKALMQTHSIRSAELVATISAFRGIVEQAVRHHHENYDGTGYPQGLAGESIPIGARVIMVADTIDAMTTDRPYRLALKSDRLFDELRRYSGRQFDPRMVAIVLASKAIRRMIAVRVGESVPISTPPSLLQFGRRPMARTGAGN